MQCNGGFFISVTFHSHSNIDYVNAPSLSTLKYLAGVFNWLHYFFLFSSIVFIDDHTECIWLIYGDVTVAEFEGVLIWFIFKRLAFKLQHTWECLIFYRFVFMVPVFIYICLMLFMIFLAFVLRPISQYHSKFQCIEWFLSQILRIYLSFICLIA